MAILFSPSFKYFSRFRSQSNFPEIFYNAVIGLRAVNSQRAIRRPSVNVLVAYDESPRYRNCRAKWRNRRATSIYAARIKIERCNLFERTNSEGSCVTIKVDDNAAIGRKKKGDGTIARNNIKRQVYVLKCRRCSHWIAEDLQWIASTLQVCSRRVDRSH